MTSPTPTNEPVSTAIADLLAWARSLSEAWPAADPTEQAAKTALLARPTHQHPDTSLPPRRTTCD